ncbi:nucleoside phosphorylase domain-containing protein [Trichoderma evansii]
MPWCPRSGGNALIPNLRNYKLGETIISDPLKYTISWICAILTEYVAAQAFLDNKHKKPKYVSTHNNNNYTLGKIRWHNIIIAVLPNSKYGLSSAAGVARDMLHSFLNIRIGLMVRIGGGAPSAKHDIRLGDVVVGILRDREGSVVQYNFGKAIQDQDGLIAEHKSKGNQIQESRPKQGENNNNPAIHYSLITLANILIKDALQGYIAITAAAYIKNLLSQIALNKVKAKKKISNVLSG